MFNLDALEASSLYSIFDDFFDWRKFSSYKQWLGAQDEFTLTDKYRKKVVFKWGKPTIILSNQYPDFEDGLWIKANCFIVQINNNKLY